MTFATVSAIEDAKKALADLTSVLERAERDLQDAEDERDRAENEIAAAERDSAQARADRRFLAEMTLDVARGIIEFPELMESAKAALR